MWPPFKNKNVHLICPQYLHFFSNCFALNIRCSESIIGRFLTAPVSFIAIIRLHFVHRNNNKITREIPIIIRRTKPKKLIPSVIVWVSSRKSLWVFRSVVYISQIYINVLFYAGFSLSNNSSLTIATSSGASKPSLTTPRSIPRIVILILPLMMTDCS